MKSIEANVLRHGLLSLLISDVKNTGIVLSPDRYIRLQRLWQMLPDDCPMPQLRNLLCPVFATDERQQEGFYDAFDRIIKDLEAVTREKPEERLTESPIEEGRPKQDTPKAERLNPILSDKPQSESKLRPLVVDLEQCTDPPYSWNIAPKDNLAEIHVGESFNRTLLHLRRREWADHSVIDVVESIKATIDNGCLPSLCYKRQTRPAEYLLLVERFSRNDHRAAILDYVFQTLRANDVLVERFFYDSDPQINRNEQYPAGLNLHELRQRYPDDRLVLLGSGHRLLNPRTGRLADWGEPLLTWRTRALLTPVPHGEWGYRERQLDKDFLLLPASVESLQYIAESPDLGNIQYELLPDYIREIAEMEPLQLQEPIMRSLRQHFDSAMLCWIAACAVYPALHFELTRQLGKIISDSFASNLLTSQNLLALSRLTWFTNGRIPLSVRRDLMKYLEQRHPERRMLVIRYLCDLMKQNKPSEENKNSMAYAEHRVNLAILKAMSGEIDQETAAELRAVVKRLDGDAAWGDFVLPEAWEELMPYYEEPDQYLSDIPLSTALLEEKISYFKKLMIDDEITTLLIEIMDFDSRFKAQITDISKKIDLVNNTWIKKLCTIDEYLDTRDIYLREVLNIVNSLTYSSLSTASHFESDADYDLIANNLSSSNQLEEKQRLRSIESTEPLPEELSVWKQLLDSYNNGTVLSGKVLRRSKKSLILDYNGIEVVMPNYEIHIHPVTNYSIFIGKVMDFKVIKPNSKPLVSHKALAKENFTDQREKLVKILEKGQVIEGIVKKITDYGAIIDLGGADGLLYIADISWERIQHPSEALTLNQHINVIVLDFDENKKGISLGLKQLKPQYYSWKTLKEGSVVNGRVVRIEDFGAIIELQPGVEGLIHRSEIHWTSQNVNMRQFFKIGQEIEARIVALDRKKRRMSLSVKQLTPDPWNEIERLCPVGSRFKGTVKNIANYGIFVELQDGIGGMVHISDLSWTKRYAHPSEFIKVGEKLEVLILDVDKEKRQITLGHKQTQENPWKTFELTNKVGSYLNATCIKHDNHKRGIFLLPNGIEALGPTKHITKDDGSIVDVNETVMVKILELDKDSQRIIVSHTKYLEDLKTNNLLTN